MRLLIFKLTIFLISLLFCTYLSIAQQMTGRIYDMENGEAMADVVVHNIFTDQVTFSDAQGKFTINAKKGELVEFKMIGYNTHRIRLHGNPASYYNIGMVIGAIELEDFTVYGNASGDRVLDSIKTAEVFEKAINFQKIEGMDKFFHPLTALSKENRRKWAFQERYVATERDKYIEHIFNDRLIQNLTKLGTDSLSAYKHRFRPSYYNLIEWNEYEYYIYIKNTVQTFRNNARYYQYKYE